MRNGKESKIHIISNNLVWLKRCKGTALLSALCIALIVSGFSPYSAYSNEVNNKEKQQTHHVGKNLIMQIKIDQPAKHCVKKIEVKKQYLYMTDNWYRTAEQETKRLWKQSVIKRFGSVYGKWDVAQNKKYECQRIGFGNDDAGNIGASVVCLIAADPCVILLNR